MHIDDVQFEIIHQLPHFKGVIALYRIFEQASDGSQPESIDGLSVFYHSDGRVSRIGALSIGYSNKGEIIRIGPTPVRHLGEQCLRVGWCEVGYNDRSITSIVDISSIGL